MIVNAAYLADHGMSFILDLLQSTQSSSHDLLLDSWPVELQPTRRDSKQGYEQCTDLGASVSKTRPVDVVKDDSQTSSTCNGDVTGVQSQTQSPNNDLGTSGPAQRPSAAQRKLQSNRQAQKRFRERQKVFFSKHILRSSWSHDSFWQRQCLCRKGRIQRKQSC